jgi:hypothetical protein
MGYKSRGNFNIPFCLKVDCVNQGFKEVCDNCFRLNKYSPAKKVDCVSDGNPKIISNLQK